MIIGGIILCASQQSTAVIGGILLTILGVLSLIYITVRICLAAACVLDKGMNPWAAITSSFAMTRANFWRLVALFILQNIIVIVSLIPLLLGLIWTLPLSLILYGTIYQFLSLRPQVQPNIQ